MRYRIFQKRELYDLDVDCGTKMDNETISGRCRNIRQKLTNLLIVPDNESAQVSTTVTSSSIKDVLERFMLWAGNLGALQKPASKLSLDSRLASSSDLRDYICTELEDLSEAIEDLTNIMDGSMPNREIGYGSGSENNLDMQSEGSSCSENSIDEASSILQVISQGITSLLKVGILVRQPASSETNRFHRAIRDSASAFLDRFDIDYVQHKHPKLGSGGQSLRIGKAIAKRRQFIRYCRDHNHNLAAEEDQGKIGSQKATTAKQSSKATTFIATENLRDILQGSVEEEDDTVSHCSISTTSESLAILKLPRLADLSPDDEPFECPICYTLQKFRSEPAWRRHAYRDLKAYVCTVGGTECDEKFFDDRTSWFNHEFEQHRCSYVCVLCGANDGKNKTTRSLLRQHILSAHGDFESGQLERLEDASRDTAITLKAKDCPFCDDWSELIARKMHSGKTAQPRDDFIISTSRFKKHVAMHLEQLAIFALPRHDHNTDMDDDGSHGSPSRVMYSRSSASLAESFLPDNERFIEEHQSVQAPSMGEGSIAHAWSETEKSSAPAPVEELDPMMQELKEEVEEFKLEKGERKLQAEFNAEWVERASEEAQTAAEDCMGDEEGYNFWAEGEANLERTQERRTAEFEALLKADERQHAFNRARHEGLLREATIKSKEEHLQRISADEQPRKFISDYDLSRSLGSNHNEQTMPTGIPTFTGPVIPPNDPALAQDEQESSGLENKEEHGQTHAGQTEGSLRHEGQQWLTQDRREIESDMERIKSLLGTNLNKELDDKKQYQLDEAKFHREAIQSKEHKKRIQKNIWYCSCCNTGPNNFEIDDDCPNCNHTRCSSCTVTTITIDPAY